MSYQTVTSRGSTLGAVLLIAGCCIGAGMLGLPVLSSQAGYYPSAILFTVSWLFMFSTGLLVLEANLWFDKDINVVSLASYTLGRGGKVVSWIIFLFLFYSLMVAYVTGSGELFSDFFEAFFATPLPLWVGGLCMIMFFGMMIYLGTGSVDRLNRFLMISLVVSYILLISIGYSHIKIERLKHENWKAIYLVIPAMITSFGFHNLIPSLTHYLGRESRRLRRVLFLGSLIPLMIYLIWQSLILGIVPLEGKGGLLSALDKGQMATHVLKDAVGNAWIVDIAQFFAFFAIVTSFLGVAWSFVDFLADGLHIPKVGMGKFSLCALALVPPYLFSLIYPQAFLLALNYAGGFGAVILFGILPALIVWSGRYKKGFKGAQLVGGGKPVLLVIIFCSVSILCLQLYQSLV